MDSDLDTRVRAQSTDPLATGAKKGIDRRTLIKRAAATGAVAWTAPIILDSMASPAGALSCGIFYRIELQMSVSCQGTETATCAATGKGTLTVGGYAADDCYDNISGATNGSNGILVPPGGNFHGTPVNVVAGQAISTTCVTLTPSGANTVVADGKDSCFLDKTTPPASCDSRLNNNVIATVTPGCKPTSTGLSSCSGVTTFLAAGYNWRTSDCDNYCRTWKLGGTVQKSGNTSASCTDRAGATNDSHTIVSPGATSITFNQPASNKGPEHSGSYQFVLGCNCT